MYIGQDPTGGGFLRIAVESMTPAQLAAWVLIDPATARRYVDPTKLPAYKIPKFDNAPGAPLPKLKKHEPTTDKGRAKAEDTERD